MDEVGRPKRTYCGGTVFTHDVLLPGAFADWTENTSECSDT